jgi:hypothetical protein
MKIQNPRYSIPSASHRLIEAAAVPVTAWNRRDDEELAAIRKSEQFAAARAARTAAVKYLPKPPCGTADLLIEEQAMFLPFNPPQFRTKKDGGQVEVKMRLPFLAVTAGAYVFKVTRGTDPATILRRAAEIRRRCGEAAAERFAAEAVAFVTPEENPEEKNPTPPKAVGWDAPASGRDCRRGFHTASRIVPLNYHRPQ